LTHDLVLWLKMVAHVQERSKQDKAHRKKRVKASLALVEVAFEEQRRIAQLIS